MHVINFLKNKSKDLKKIKIAKRISKQTNTLTQNKKFLRIQ